MPEWLTKLINLGPARVTSNDFKIFETCAAVFWGSSTNGQKHDHVYPFFFLNLGSNNLESLEAPKKHNIWKAYFLVNILTSLLGSLKFDPAIIFVYDTLRNIVNARKRCTITQKMRATITKVLSRILFKIIHLTNLESYI